MSNPIRPRRLRPARLVQGADTRNPSKGVRTHARFAASRKVAGKVANSGTIDEPGEAWVEIPFDEPQYEEIWFSSYLGFLDGAARHRILPERAARFADATLGQFVMRFRQHKGERKIGFKRD